MLGVLACVCDVRRVHEHPDVERVIEAEAGVTFDRRHLPVALATWVGPPSLALIAQAQVWIDDVYARARAAGMPGVAIISDARQAELPDMQVRRRLLELRHDPALMVKVVAVVPAHNTMVRGILNGLTWVLGDGRYSLATSLPHAAEIIKRAFEQRGLAAPELFGSP